MKKGKYFCLFKTCPWVVFGWFVFILKINFGLKWYLNNSAQMAVEWVEWIYQAQTESNLI